MRGFNVVSTKYLNNYLVWNNLVNYAKESGHREEHLLNFRFSATLKTAKCKRFIKQTSSSSGRLIRICGDDKMVNITDVKQILQFAIDAEIKVFLDGGWGVDALLGYGSKRP